MLTAALTLGLAGSAAWQPSTHPAPRILGEPPSTPRQGVIIEARARQHQRRQRITQAAADTTAAGGEAAASWWLHTLLDPQHGHHPLPSPGSSGPEGLKVLGEGCLSGDSGIASDGRHVWVTYPTGNTVLEFSASTGAFVADFGGAGYGFNEPTAVASDGTHVWVANQNSDAVTELNAATGHLVQVLQGLKYGFRGPDAVASDGTHVWVTNERGDTVTELDAATGYLIEVLQGPSYGFDWPALWPRTAPTSG